MLFVGIVVTLLAFDLGVLHKDDKEIEVKESLFLSAGLYQRRAAVWRVGVVVSGSHQRHGIPNWLHDRKIAVHGQRICNGHDFYLPGDSPHVPAPGIVLGYLGRDRIASHHDWLGCDAGVTVQLDCVCIRRVFGGHYWQNTARVFAQRDIWFDCWRCTGVAV